MTARHDGRVTLPRLLVGSAVAALGGGRHPWSLPLASAVVVVQAGQVVDVVVSGGEPTQRM